MRVPLGAFASTCACEEYTRMFSRIVRGGGTTCVCKGVVECACGTSPAWALGNLSIQVHLTTCAWSRDTCAPGFPQIFLRLENLWASLASFAGRLGPTLADSYCICKHIANWQSTSRPHDACKNHLGTVPQAITDYTDKTMTWSSWETVGDHGRVCSDIIVNSGWLGNSKRHTGQCDMSRWDTSE